MTKIVLVGALALCAATAPLAAQDHADHADHAVDAPAAAMGKFTLDTPIETIVADPRGKAALDANLPGMTTHEHYEMFKAMTLNQLAAMAGDKIPAELVTRVGASLAAIQ